MTNPFRASFGAVPPFLAGRDVVLDEFEAALDQGPGAEGRASLVMGARGTGKTVLLTEMESIARDHDWQVISLHTSSASLLEEARIQAVEILRELDPDAARFRPTGASVGGVASLQGEMVDEYGDPVLSAPSTLRRLTELLRGDAGLLFTLDEVQAVDLDLLAEFAQIYQDLVRTEQDVAFVGAGVGAGVRALLDSPQTTFLRRARRVEIGMVDLGSAAGAIRATVAATDKTIGPDAAVRAAEIAQGYPYLIQYVGAQAWANAGDEPEIALEDVERSRAGAIAQMATNIHDPALRGLSAKKREYLEAMLVDPGPSAVADIAVRLGVSAGYQSVYRDRLIEDELIRPGERGTVEFALPYLREALLARAARGDDVPGGLGSGVRARRSRGARG
ncbi:ATP-binding protein [Brachybacterium huguangmaarense]